MFWGCAMNNDVKERDTYSFWEQQIRSVKDSQEYKDYLKTAKVILNRYNNRQCRIDNNILNITEYGDSKISNDGYNIVYKITDTILPFIIPYIPEIVVERKDKDNDIIANISSRVLERLLNNFCKEDDFKDIIDDITRDAWLQGQGVAWVNKEIKVKQFESVNEFGENVISEEIDDECITIDYVAPEDFFHNTARNEKELEWVSKRIFLSKNDFQNKFEVEDIDEYIDKTNKSFKKDKIIVYEIWDKVDRKIRYFSEKTNVKESTNDNLLKIEDYPEGFDFDFPCVILQFFKKTNSLIPTPILDNIIYLQQVIDLQTRKIKLLNDELQIKMIYDKSLGGLDSALSANNNNKAYPVENMDKFAERGLQNIIMFFPLDEIINALKITIEARQNNIDKAMELVGDNPILEGITNSQEAYGTNRIKGSFGTMRVQEYQKIKINFLNKLLKKISTIFCTFDPYFLIKQSNIMFDLSEDDKKFLPQSLEMLKQETVRNIRLIIETDSTKAYYDEGYRMQINDFFSSLINNLGVASNTVQIVPAFAGVLKNIIMATIRSQRIGRSFESEIDKALDHSIQQLMQQQTSNQQIQPDPTKIAEIQAKGQIELQKTQMEIAQRNKESEDKFKYEMFKQTEENKRKEADIAKDYRKQDIDREIAEAKLLLANKELELEADLESQGIKANIGTGVF